MELDAYLLVPLAIAAAPLVWVLLITAGVAALTAVALWIGRNDPRDEVQEALFAGRRFSLPARAVGLVVEGFWQSVAFALQLLHHALRGSRRVWIDPAGSGTPVVLVAGYLENSGTMWVLGRKLRARGFRVVHVDLPNTLRRIEKNAAWLRDTLESIRQETGAAELAYVGHSMGGVIGRALLHCDPPPPLPIKTVVTIGSPHRGTRVARWGPGPSARDMCPLSEHVCRYPHGQSRPVPVHTLVAVQDEITTPAWAAVLGEGEDVLLDLPLGHVGPLFLSRVADQVERWLLAAGVARVAAPDGRPAAVQAA